MEASARACPPRFVGFEGYQVDLQTGELRKNGSKVRLSGQPFQILALLLEKPGELITREELRARLWPDKVFVEERAAKMLDPLFANTLAFSVMNSYFRREHDKGLAQAREALALYPGISAFHIYWERTSSRRKKS
jgi:hypothetical protein